MTKPRVLTLDIETSPLESYHWGLWDQTIGLNQIKTESSILSFSAKWLGEKKVHYFDTGGRGAAKVRDDKALLGKLWEFLDATDIVVGQNVRDFDLKRINARMLMHGLPPYSPVRVIDTYLEAKRRFGFTSSKLEWMSTYLTATKKRVKRKFAGFELWKGCLADKAAAWREMKLYNGDDVRATEQLFLKLRPWISGVNIAAYTDSEKPACPKCGSFKIVKNGRAFTQSGYHDRYKCQACGGYSKGRKNEASKAKRGALLGA